MPSESSITDRLLHEPLVHFLVLAVLLFALEAAFSGARKETIFVDQQTIAYLIQQREDLELRKLSSNERQETIATFVEDEIFYREAYRRGLDRGDSRMRRNLILKMRGLVVGDVEAPSEEALRAFFEKNRVRFASPATWSLEHVYFSDPGQVTSRLLEELRAGLDPTKVGETMLSMGNKLPRRTQREIAVTFGAEVARAILEFEDDQWHGPFESPRGAHFVRVVSREPAQEGSFESAKSYVEGEWVLAQSRKAIEQEIERLLDDYEVIIDDVREPRR
jgi:hypothetical protein